MTAIRNESLSLLDKDSVSRLQIHQKDKIEGNKELTAKWLTHKKDYDKLLSRLENLESETSYEVMIPFGKKAFMPGRLRHTNEILVLLGENWFAERSVKQAREIAKRRLIQCETMLSQLNQERKLFENWRQETEKILQNDEGLLEILEPYNEENERLWREKHRENLKKKSVFTVESDETEKDLEKEKEDIWRCLDELEIEEELEKEEDYGRSEEEDSGDWSESPSLSDEETLVIPKRKVSFGNVITHGESFEDKRTQDSRRSIIFFAHSHSNVSLSSLISPSSAQLHPGNLKMYLEENNKKAKSILKPFDSNSIITQTSKDNSSHKLYFTNADKIRVDPPVKSSIQEKGSREKNPLFSSSLTPPPRKMSQFKMSRVNK